VSSLPGSAAEGATAVLTTDGQLYRYHAGAWTVAVPAANVTGMLSDSQIAALNAAKLTGQITTTQITNGAVTTPLLAAGAVTTTQIAANTITAGNIAAATITSAQIAAGTITANNIQANTITSGQIAANTITAGQIAAGAIGVNQLAAQAVTATKLYIGDTTNLILDPNFSDHAYWSLLSAVSGANYYQTSALGNYVNTPTYLVIGEGAFSSGSANYGAGTPPIPVTANETYVFSFDACAVGGIPTFDLVIQANYVDASGAGISSAGYAIHGTGSIQNASVTLTPPTNAASVQCYAYVNATGAGTGYWCVGNMKLLRRLQGSLIVDGTITATQIAAGTITATQIMAGTIDASKIAAGTLTAAQIQAGGITGTNIAGGTITGSNLAVTTITGTNIAAGTITGDKIAANFFQGYDFTASSGGSGYVQMNGGQSTSAGLTYGPYFATVDSAGRLRSVLGHYAGADGLWIWDASGNVIFEESSLGTSVVGTGNVQSNAISYAYGASLTPGNFVLFSHTADAAGDFVFMSAVGLSRIGTTGSPPGYLKLDINGTTVLQEPSSSSFTSDGSAFLGGSVAVNAGDNIDLHFVETNASSIDTNGGSMFGAILQR
jgi:hypothetical protein